ncbi:MAG: hypothetical protein AMXMBFR56_39200 [Polyangiaceae bacterium]
MDFSHLAGGEANKMKTLRRLAMLVLLGMASSLSGACGDEPGSSGGGGSGAADAASDVTLETSSGGQAGGGTGGSEAGAGGQDGSVADSAGEADAVEADAVEADAVEADAGCQGPFQDCDGNPANGCETDTSTSLGSCGGCGKYCLPTTTGLPSCVNGVCVVTCAPGWGDCDGVPGNGCEEPLQVSPIHCGACGNACANSPCIKGACLADAGAGDAAADAGGDASPSDGAAPDSGSSDSGGADAGFGLDPSCVKPGSVVVQCNPVTTVGCQAGAACDLAYNGTSAGFVCFPEGPKLEGQSCNNATGPWCKPTMNCDDDNLCHKMCCSDADCTGTFKTCKATNPTVVGTFGLCY